MEDENGSWKANRGIPDNTEGITGPNSDAGDTVNGASASLETLSALIKELTADGIGRAIADQPDVTLRSPVRQSATVIEGWRAWRLVSWKLWKLQYEVLLESIMYPMIWHPAKPVKGLVGLRLPSGIHAWQTHAQCIAHKKLYGLYSRDWVIGEVSLWGHVIKHEHGYRAEYAYPRRLVVPEYLRERGDIAGDLRRTYGVECQWD